MSDEPESRGWWIYRGTGRPHSARFPPPPPWRSFTGQMPAGHDTWRLPLEDGEPDATNSRRLGRYRQAAAYRADTPEIDLINLALHLRRPLLVTGKPGVGKSTLAYSVAYELKLGPVLRWPITSRSTLREGLYSYDAVGRLQAVGLQQKAAAADSHGDDETTDPLAIGDYLTLGPLGTALLPARQPRVLLIDELDKSDIDLPNDLLNVFEDGEFDIPELARLKQRHVPVGTADPGRKVTLEGGRVRCAQFPFVVLTSNAERDFPMAFKRRCIRLNIEAPSAKKLSKLVEAHFEPADAKTAAQRRELIETFIKKRQDADAVLANDQLLNALLMAARGLWGDDDGRQLIDTHVLRPLEET